MSDAKNDAVVLARALMRRWYQFVFLGAAAGFATYMWSVSQPRSWTSSLTVTAEAGPQSLNVAIATELGVGAGTESQSPDFYAEYLRTDASLLSVVKRRYVTVAGDSTDLATLLRVAPGDSEVRLEKAIRVIRRLIVPSVTRRAGTVTVTVTMPDPLVAKQVAEEVGATLNELNTKVRQTMGRAERQFAEDRMRVAAAELREAEDSLRNFLEKNRNPEASPGLHVEKLRRERVMSWLQDVLSSLQVAYENARMEELRNTPRISVIVEPRMPLIGNARGTAGKMILASSSVCALLLLLAFAAERSAGGSLPRLFSQSRRELQQLRRGP
jgi:capsule polysaccharide export protein KpsE/RkpR